MDISVLSPTPPFSHTPRLKLAALVLPLLFATTVFRSALFVKTATFGIGFGMFGQPVITRSAHELTRRFPNWREMLELRRSILKGVPTNAQLTITLLRIAEENKTPLPPPPSTNKVTEIPEEHPDGPEAAVSEHDFAFDTSNYEIENTDSEAGNMTDDADGMTEGNKSKPKSGSKLVRIFKGTSKATVSSVLGVDHLKAKLGSEAAKRRLGAAPESKVGITTNGPTGSRVGLGDGPTTYAGRFHGRRGYVVLVTSAASPFVSFVYEKDLSKNLASAALAAAGKTVGSSSEAPPAVFTKALAEIQGLKKIGGYGWKGKLIIGWALQREIVDGLEIEDNTGESRTITAIKGRDELFNRLVAMGGHHWECW